MALIDTRLMTPEQARLLLQDVLKMMEEGQEYIIAPAWFSTLWPNPVWPNPDDEYITPEERGTAWCKRRGVIVREQMDVTKLVFRKGLRHD